ncbi:MAG: sulfatase [Acidobacteria bacterium]|nr:sulfatase [Acidobacteriota bacterium]
MQRRAFLAALGATALVSAAPAKPNVLFIAVDDLNDWISCLGGHPQSKTPNFDRLAAMGTLFTSAHCAAPLCNPSRAALMTGIHPSSSGVYTNNQPWRGAKLLAKAVTLPQYFTANGYRSIGSGKTYHDSYADPESWEAYFPTKKQQKPVDPKPAKLPANGLPGGNLDWGPLTVTDEAMGDHKVVDWVTGQMNAKQDKPLFLACGLYKPHLPWHIPQKYFDLYPLDSIILPKINGDDLDDVPPIGKKFAKPNGDHKMVTDAGLWKQGVQAYLAAIAFADAELGRLLDAYDKSEFKKNSVIVLWSDHGWHLGEKLHWRKFSLWEEATHNVLMMVAPGLTKPNTRCDRTVSLMDVYPTLVDLCGLPKRPELEGVSLRPLLTNPNAAWDRPAVTTYFRNNHSVRSDAWRYIRYEDGTEELYDRVKDPLEWKNLAADPKLAPVKLKLAKWLPTVNAENAPSDGRGGE